MPVNGLVFAADKVQIGIGCSTIPATPGFGELCRNESLYTPDAINVAVGIAVYLVGVGSTWNAVYRGPNEPFGGYVSSGHTGTAGTIDCYLNDWKLYARYDSTWHVECSGIDIYVNGSLATSLAGFSLTSSALGPSWVPVFAGLCSITGGGTTTGGWRWYANGGWHDLPIAIPTVADAPTSGTGTDGSFHPIPVTAPFGLAASDALVGTSTWGTQINAFPLPPPSGGPDYDIQGASGSIILIPNLPKSFPRMAPNHGADLYRFSVPRCYGSSTRGIERTGPGYFKLATFTNTTDIVPASAAVGEEVGDSAGTCEACLSLPTYSIITAWRNRTRESGGGTVFDVETLTTQYPTYVDASAGAPYMQHADIRAQYFNSAVCNPHWHFFYTPGGWDVDGSPESWSAYWGVVRQQHLITSTKRNHIVASPLEYSAFTGWLDTYVGPGFRWAGISRWQTKSTTPLADYTYDSGSSVLWSVDTGSLTFDATGPKSTPGGSFAGNVEFKLRLYSFADGPMQWPALADTITADWVAGNISACTVYLEGRNGERVKLTDVAGVATRKPAGSPTKYCGSWVQDYGADGVVDQGADQDAGGDSTSVYGTATTCFAAQGLADYTAAYLVFVVTPTTASSPVQVKYPRLQYTLSAARAQYVESGQDQIIVHPSGPGVRFGDWVWYSGGWLSSPLVGPGTYKSTVIDILEFGRICLEGVAYDYNFTTELTALYDSYEGNSVGQVDGSSLGFVLPNSGETAWRLALVNTVAEVPPMCSFPRGVRDASDWSESAASFAQAAYVWDQGKTVTVATNVAGHIFDPSDVQWTTSGSGVSGWAVAEHTHALTESESGFKAKNNATQRAKDLRPWHGWFEVCAADQQRRNPTNAATWMGFYHRATVVDSGGIESRRVRYPVPKAGPTFDVTVQVTTDATDKHPQVNYDPYRDRVTLVWGRGDDTYYSETYDEGKTWSTPVSMITGGHYPRIASNDLGTVYAALVYNSGSSGPGTIKAKFRGRDDVLSSLFTFKDSTGTDIAVADDSFDLVHPPAGWAPLVLHCRIDGETDTSEWYCTDLSPSGATFTRVT